MYETLKEYGGYQEIIDNSTKTDLPVSASIEKIAKKFFENPENLYQYLEEKIQQIIKKTPDKIDTEDEIFMGTIISINEQSMAKRALGKPETTPEMEIKLHDLAQEIKNYKLNAKK